MIIVLRLEDVVMLIMLGFVRGLWKNFCRVVLLVFSLVLISVFSKLCGNCNFKRICVIRLVFLCVICIRVVSRLLFWLISRLNLKVSMVSLSRSIR